MCRVFNILSNNCNLITIIKSKCFERRDIMHTVIFKIHTYSLAVFKSFFHKIYVSIYIHVIDYLKDIQIQFFIPVIFTIILNLAFRKYVILQFYSIFKEHFTIFISLHDIAQVLFLIPQTCFSKTEFRKCDSLFPGI